LRITLRRLVSEERSGCVLSVAMSEHSVTPRWTRRLLLPVTLTLSLVLAGASGAEVLVTRAQLHRLERQENASELVAATSPARSVATDSGLVSGVQLTDQVHSLATQVKTLEQVQLSQVRAKPAKDPRVATLCQWVIAEQNRTYSFHGPLC
jgi:hypothetical protein